MNYVYLVEKLGFPLFPPICPEKMARFPRVFSVFGIGFLSMYWKMLEFCVFPETFRVWSGGLRSCCLPAPSEFFSAPFREISP